MSAVKLILVMQFDIYDPVKIKSHPGIRKDLFTHDLRKTLVTDFFGGVAQVETTYSTQGSDSTEWDELRLPAHAAMRDSEVSDAQNASLPRVVASGHDIRAPTSGPKQDWIVLVILVGLLWALRRRSLRPHQRTVQRKVKAE